MIQDFTDFVEMVDSLNGMPDIEFVQDSFEMFPWNNVPLLCTKTKSSLLFWKPTIAVTFLLLFYKLSSTQSFQFVIKTVFMTVVSAILRLSPPKDTPVPL